MKLKRSAVQYWVDLFNLKLSVVEKEIDLNIQRREVIGKRYSNQQVNKFKPVRDSLERIRDQYIAMLYGYN